MFLNTDDARRSDKGLSKSIEHTPRKGDLGQRRTRDVRGTRKRTPGKAAERDGRPQTLQSLLKIDINLFCPQVYVNDQCAPPVHNLFSLCTVTGVKVAFDTFCSANWDEADRL